MPTTLQEFEATLRDTTSKREGWKLYPDKEEDKAIERIALASGMQPSALADVFLAYTRNEFDLNSITVWIDAQRIKRPHLWPTVGVYALAAQAFSENGALNLTARARLVNEIGEKAADTMAKQWGLSGLTDYKTKGVRPSDAEAALNSEADKLESEIAERQARLAQVKAANGVKDTGKVSHASNPFHKSHWNVSEQGKLVKALGEEKARAIARSVGVDLGATRPNPAY